MAVNCIIVDRLVKYLTGSAAMSCTYPIDFVHSFQHQTAASTLTRYDLKSEVILRSSVSFNPKIVRLRKKNVFAS